MTLNERWLPIPGLEGAYEVSDHGRIRSLDRVITNKFGVKRRHRGRILALNAGRGGHLRVRLGSVKNLKVHRLVLEAFVGPCPEGYEGCHNDGNPAHNNLTNLRWASHSENMLDSVRHGTHNQVAKTHCPRGHELVAPNLKPSKIQLGKRDCLACNRARDYIRKHPGITHDLQQVSDSYHSSIMAQQTMDDYLDAA